eukprot:4271902-Prymnesium_polylepis.1
MLDLPQRNTRSARGTGARADADVLSQRDLRREARATACGHLRRERRQADSPKHDRHAKLAKVSQPEHVGQRRLRGDVVVYGAQHHLGRRHDRASDLYDRRLDYLACDTARTALGQHRVGVAQSLAHRRRPPARHPQHRRRVAVLGEVRHAAERAEQHQRRLRSRAPSSSTRRASALDCWMLF